MTLLTFPFPLPSFNRPSSLLLALLLLWEACVLADLAADHLQSKTIKNRQVKGVTEPTLPIRTHSIYAREFGHSSNSALASALAHFLHPSSSSLRRLGSAKSLVRLRWFDEFSVFIIAWASAYMLINLFATPPVINTNKHIRLTQDRASQAGVLWSRQPITQANFQIEVEFKIDGKSSSVFGDGMAMWLVKSSALYGPVFGSADRWSGFGVFIDTFPNSRHSYAFPRILGMSNNGYVSYNVGKDGDEQEAGACSMSVRRSDVATKLRLTYIRSEFLEVLIHHDKWDEWTHCFTVWNYTLPESPLLGFTAHTGEVSDAHDIVSVATTGVVYHPPEEIQKSNSKKTQSIWESSPYGGIGSGGMGFGARVLAYLGWIVKWGTVVGCVGLAAFGGKKVLGKYQKESLKRF